MEFIEKMPFEPSANVWETLMNLCRVHGHLELGDRRAELVEQLDPSRLNEQSKSGLIMRRRSCQVKVLLKSVAGSMNIVQEIHYILRMIESMHC